ncbi:MAG: two-component system response regulator [Halobacteriovoraceae bacterium]|nr:two-component system response regulator [Halobacteriovoraceae bacterium]|tara:strand:- start:255710 stop:256075 length:366 start_codon:yes stop_codon:yes gene_type:complete
MNSIKVLIVDDEAELREAIAGYLELEDFECFTASNGVEAFNIIEKESISFVISDIRMPGGDGVELLKRIKAKYPDIPLVMLMTGFAEVTETQVLKMGGLGILEKPINMQALVKNLRSYFPA